MNKPKFYLRYIDDILAVFEKEQDSWNRLFRICNNWNSFHKDIESIKSNLIKNAYPPFLIVKIIKTYLDNKFSSNQSQLKDRSDVYYFKLPYIGNLSTHIKNKLSKIYK